MEYKGYQHIERLGTSEVEGILNGKVYVYPKIDGTNGQAWFDGEQIFVGSRKRFITPEDDNAGCARAILQDEKICKYLKDHIEYHLFFEWLVPHTIKNYEVDAWRKPYIFDVAVKGENNTFNYLSYEEYSEDLKRYGLNIIEPLSIIDNPTQEELMKIAENNHYLMQEGFTGEGVVMKNYDYLNKYGRKIWAKLVLAEFREKKKEKANKPKINIQNDIELAIVEKYITESFVQKEKAKIENEVGGWESKYIKRLLSTIWYSFIKEESYNFVKFYKNPTINFRELNRLCLQKTKEILGI